MPVVVPLINTTIGLMNLDIRQCFVKDLTRCEQGRSIPKKFFFGGRQILKRRNRVNVEAHSREHVSDDE